MKPDPDHDAVCASTARHQVVVAPPGSGKTHVAVRLAGVWSAELPPGARVLVLTFSNQARTQLEREAARQLEPAVRARVLITNYHRFFWHAVRAHRRALGLPLELDVGSAARRIEAMRSVAPDEVKQLSRHSGLLEAFAELKFAAFRDDRSPDPVAIDRLLRGVDAEQRAGRLVFDDLGALFWQLLDRYPTLDAAYGARYPRVIADEHQDASGLQDAVVRKLGSARLAVLADPMQLIHGFRGARDERLTAHLADCNERYELRTAHRWSGNEGAARWLFAVRARLLGSSADVPRPQHARILTSRASHGFNATLSIAARETSRAFRGGCQRVAVLAYRNDDVGKLRNYLRRKGMYPRQVSAPRDFEDARHVIEQLPLLTSPPSLARYALDQLRALVPTLPKAVTDQVARRLRADRVDQHQASAQARPLLTALSRLYEGDAGCYFSTLVDALNVCVAQGHHPPQPDAVRVLRDTSATLGSNVTSLDAALATYGTNVFKAAQRAPPDSTGLYVMTAHQAKGKEFDAIILAGANAQNFPDTPEGTRLLYVALTRATRHWSVIAPDSGASPLLRHL